MVIIHLLILLHFKCMNFRIIVLFHFVVAEQKLGIQEKLRHLVLFLKTCLTMDTVHLKRSQNSKNVVVFFKYLNFYILLITSSFFLINVI